jgi:hypothetical protein
LRKPEVHWADIKEDLKTLKEEIFGWSRVPIRQQILTWRDEYLADEKSLQDYDIPFDGTLSVSRISKTIARAPRWNVIMSSLELDHYSYLLKKVVKLFRAMKEPQDDVLQIIVTANLDCGISLREMARSYVILQRSN